MYPCRCNVPPRQVYQERRPNQIIGIINPPRAGPLQTNVQFPIREESARRPFTVLYSEAPFIRKFY